MQKSNRKPIGLAVIGCGRIGRIRAQIAAQFNGVEWIGLCDRDERLGKKLTEDMQADFFTTDYRELLKRPEANTTIVATDEINHFQPVLAAAEAGHDLLIEKPIATDTRDSATLSWPRRWIFPRNEARRCVSRLILKNSRQWDSNYETLIHLIGFVQ